MNLQILAWLGSEFFLLVPRKNFEVALREGGGGHTLRARPLYTMGF